MRAPSYALALLSVFLAVPGCGKALVAKDHPIAVAAHSNTEDLRGIRAEVVGLLPEASRSTWNTRLIAYVVRSLSIEAGLAGDTDFDVRRALTEEQGKTDAGTR